MISVRVRANVTETVKQLNGIAGRAGKMRSVMIGPWRTSLKEMFRDAFNKEGAIQGLGKWKGLTPKYLAWKRRKGYPTVIGIRKDHMRKSLVEKGRRGAISKADATSSTVGTSIPYAIHFHRRRPLLPSRLPDKTAREMQRAMLDFIINGKKSNG